MNHAPGSSCNLRVARDYRSVHYAWQVPVFTPQLILSQTYLVILCDAESRSSTAAIGLATGYIEPH